VHSRSSILFILFWFIVPSLCTLKSSIARGKTGFSRICVWFNISSSRKRCFESDRRRGAKSREIRETGILFRLSATNANPLERQARFLQTRRHSWKVCGASSSALVSSIDSCEFNRTPHDYAIDKHIFDLSSMNSESFARPPLGPGINFTLSKNEWRRWWIINSHACKLVVSLMWSMHNAS